MKTIEIWVGGYAATCESDTAQKLGEYEAENFDQAVEKWLEKEPHRKPLHVYHNGQHSIWACRLFDNEQDARKSFG